MDRRAFLAGAAALLATPLAAEAQQAGKVFRTGYLTGNSIEKDTGLGSAFQQGLAELGYVEGKNVVIEARYAAGHFERILASAGGQRFKDQAVSSARTPTLRSTADGRDASRRLPRCLYGRS